ncbi:ABC transporter substrate-binding protein [Pseudoalteromonas fenneropenaei]|uniref:ABC transporter substrate-binding protein n=1 Tax=Pseudoalteromonas fenneropenaei TaxID=1737459 RepID=A0ABV7CPH2_9GAMM
MLIMLRYLLYVLLTLASYNALAKSVITLYVYHLKPPYILDVHEQTGLYFDVASLLNRVQDDVTYKTHYMPRKRLEKQLLDEQLDGMILGVNPLWFGDKHQTRYLWSEALFGDVDDFVSPKSKPFEFAGIETLKGKTLGGIRGYVYFAIDGIIATGEATRVDTSEEVQLLDMLAKERLDVAIVSRSTRRYLQTVHAWQDAFHISQIPHDAYKRHILAPRSRAEDFEFTVKLLSLPEVQAQLKLWALSLE